MTTTELAIFIALSLAATVAGAQVHRCEDATGKLMFSDRPCDAGQSGGQILRQRTQAEIQQERQQAYEAESRKQDRRFAEQERELAEQERRMLMQQTQPPVDDWQTRKNRENAATSAGSIANNGSRWDAKAEAERAAQRREESRRRQAAQKEFMLTCTGGICTDEYGASYSGSGATLFRSDGRTCSVTGSVAYCQ
ncbi:DUF4124 domain-containing protein [Acidovorax sp. LjRoot74]|uniref:DUF4124 domain-containing protein n=1 Tax=Acidovorax sp. LjRoot74 TaxID=3342337 RepID=UPI003ECFD370